MRPHAQVHVGEVQGPTGPVPQKNTPHTARGPLVVLRGAPFKGQGVGHVDLVYRILHVLGQGELQQLHHRTQPHHPVVQPQPRDPRRRRRRRQSQAQTHGVVVRERHDHPRPVGGVRGRADRCVGVGDHLQQGLPGRAGPEEDAVAERRGLVHAPPHLVPRLGVVELKLIKDALGASKTPTNDLLVGGHKRLLHLRLRIVHQASPLRLVVPQFVVVLRVLGALAGLEERHPVLRGRVGVSHAKIKIPHPYYVMEALAQRRWGLLFFLLALRQQARLHLDNGRHPVLHTVGRQVAGHQADRLPQQAQDRPDRTLAPHGLQPQLHSPDGPDVPADHPVLPGPHCDLCVLVA
mmetsp:Transcript_23873/g.54350  ORF Transcript_23873/g.54350 Transcript_23873/m.54350 type:complete len:349 (+) Transcript_23873:329-1375(+)